MIVPNAGAAHNKAAKAAKRRLPAFKCASKTRSKDRRVYGYLNARKGEEK